MLPYDQKTSRQTILMDSVEQKDSEPSLNVDSRTGTK